jgi:hydroxyacylglutathione hydrolase
VISVKTFVFNSFQVNTYVLYDETCQCIIVDAGYSSEYEIQQLSSFIKSNRLIPVRLIITHGHFDHILGLSYAAELFKLLPEIHHDDLFLFENAREQASFFGLNFNNVGKPGIFLNDGDLVKFGDSEIVALHVPGHSKGSLAFYSKKDNFVITGDVLFNNSIGRTDLPGGDFDTLMNSIVHKLMVLNDEVIIYPGHGPKSSIGVERKMNPFLK